MSDTMPALHAVGPEHAAGEDASELADMIARRVCTRALMVQRILPGEDVAAFRLAELWSEGETKAAPVIVWTKTDPPKRMVMVRRANGTIENPNQPRFRR